MGEFRRAAALYKALIAAALALAIAGCGQVPLKPSPAHVGIEQTARPEGTIPAPVQVAPVLPPPTPAPRPETYSVVVNNVRVQDLLFALARDAKLNVDIHPGIVGSVTLNAIDQTLPQLLSRISKQVDMRYEIDGPTLTVMRDTPYLRIYRVDYVNLKRDTDIQSSVAAQVSGSNVPGGGASGGSAQNNSTANIKTTSKNDFWITLVANLKDILRETDKIIPLNQPSATPAATTAPAAGAAGTASATPPSGPQATMEFREAASVIANAEAGILSIRATSRQHEKVQEFLDQVVANVKRQVLIEATVAEIQLNNQYQRGIDWQRFRSGATASGIAAFGTGQSGIEFRQSSANTPAGINTTAFVLGGALNSLNFSVAIKLLESFGSVRVLSSPKLSVLNNQPAVLKVTDNIVYFVVQTNITTSANTASISTTNTTPQTVPVGFVMSVLPQISDTDLVSLSVRPSITRLLRFVPDPNPNLGAIQNLVPETQTREMESLLRLQSGQIAVLGGLMQDTVGNTEDTIPGVRNIPGLGRILEQRKDTNQKSELVIFLRATVIRDPSIEGDYSRFRSLVPGSDYFMTPNPSRESTAQ